MECKKGELKGKAEKDHREKMKRQGGDGRGLIG